MSSSLALAVPISRGRVQLAPESHDKAMPAKARLKPPVSTMMRRSAAKANEAPAPAATPFIAAMTGLFIVASSSTMGL